MAVTSPLIGKHVSLICANEDDAEFTLALRNDPDLTRYIPKVTNTLEQQRSWIKNQRDKNDDMFFVMQNSKGKKVGTLSFYNIDKGNRRCELGRYVSYGNALENVEAIVLLLDYLFSKNQIESIILNIDKENKKVISLWEKFGATHHSFRDMGNWTATQYHLNSTEYYKNRTKITQLLRWE